MLTHQPVVKYAVLTDTGRVRWANEDAAGCVERDGLFIVSDGMGGLPAGGAASRIIVHAIGPLLRRGLALTTPHTDDASIESLLQRSALSLSEHMRERSKDCTGLGGWGATLVALLFRAGKAHLLNVGDSRAYLLRDRQIVQLTHDDSIINRVINAGLLITAEFEKKHANLVSQHMAMRESVTPGVRTFTPKPGDRFLLCTDGLCEPVADARIGRIMQEVADPAEACRALVAEANAQGGPDNITTLIVDWRGTKHHEVAESTPTKPKPLQPIEPPPEVGQVQPLLVSLAANLRWIFDAHARVAVDDAANSVAQARKLIGPTHYDEYAKTNPDDSPLQILHQLCLHEDSKWRREHERIAAEIDPLMATLTGGELKLCPLLTNKDTALILKGMWNEFRVLRQHYFSIRTRNPLSRQERAWPKLIQHMHENLRTIIGLLQFLPSFVC